MEKKINIQTLTALLALSTGKQKKLCEDFLRELFSIVMEEVSKGENVRIKGFGTFKLVDVEARKSVNVATGEEYEIPGHRKVIFVAAKELAALVNAPFSEFEAMEIDDSVSTESVDGESEVEAIDGAIIPEEAVVSDEAVIPDAVVPDETEIPEKAVVAGEALTLDEAVVREEAFEESSPELAAFENEETVESPKDAESADDAESEDYVESADDTELADDAESEDYVEFSGGKTGKLRFLWGFLAGIAATAVVLFGVDYFFLGGRIFSGNNGSEVAVAEVKGVDEEIGGPLDKAKTQEGVDSTLAEDETSGESENVSVKAEKGDEDSVPTAPSDRVYDTVTTTRYLTTIAKEHYGNFNLWPIIYEENKAILGHPDRIRPGTRVVVPPLSKYGVDPKNAEQVKEIKRKGVEIYSRYR